MQTTTDERGAVVLNAPVMSNADNVDELVRDVARAVCAAILTPTPSQLEWLTMTFKFLEPRDTAKAEKYSYLMSCFPINFTREELAKSILLLLVELMDAKPVRVEGIVIVRYSAQAAMVPEYVGTAMVCEAIVAERLSFSPVC